MTNRGTARRISLYNERNPNAWGKDGESPLARAMRERINRPHKERHPNDDDIPKERGVCRTGKQKRKDRRRHMDTLHILLDKQDREKAQSHPRRIIQGVAHEYMIEFWLRRDFLLDEDDPDPDPPCDDEGEAIRYPSGRGGGKNAIVEWLFKYNRLYHERKKQNKVTESINQTMLG